MRRTFAAAALALLSILAGSSVATTPPPAATFEEEVCAATHVFIAKTKKVRFVTAKVPPICKGEPAVSGDFLTLCGRGIMNLEIAFAYADMKLRGEINTTIFVFRREAVAIFHSQFIPTIILQGDDDAPTIPVQSPALLILDEPVLVRPLDYENMIGLVVLVQVALYFLDDDISRGHQLDR